MSKHKHREVIESREEITPYKNLLGAIFKQLLDDAMLYKAYKKRLHGPHKIKPATMYSIRKNYYIGKLARKFIFSSSLESLIRHWQVDLDPQYIRQVFLKREAREYKTKKPLRVKTVFA